ncbi:MAG: hypothetical protein OEM89_00750 [Nitrosopumilus sp.]|nr:hypothetical protein [Nitrosopumilus sp.]
MNKNFVIVYLVIVIAILVGSIIISSYQLFSEGWLVGLGVILVGIGATAIIIYFKIFR